MGKPSQILSAHVLAQRCHECRRAPFALGQLGQCQGVDLKKVRAALRMLTAPALRVLRIPKFLVLLSVALVQSVEGLLSTRGQLNDKFNDYNDRMNTMMQSFDSLVSTTLPCAGCCCLPTPLKYPQSHGNVCGRS